MESSFSSLSRRRSSKQLTDRRSSTSPKFSSRRPLKCSSLLRLPVGSPAEVLEEEPLYVNAKQYKRILKRRQARAKLEANGRIPKVRQ
ncbi:unnamed protein product, partial [Nesidiocoris tenuis]